MRNRKSCTTDGGSGRKLVPIRPETSSTPAGTPSMLRYVRQNLRTGTTSYNRQEGKKSLQQCDTPNHAESTPLPISPSERREQKHLKRKHNYFAGHYSPLHRHLTSKMTNTNCQPADSHGPESHKEKYEMRLPHPPPLR